MLLLVATSFTERDLNELVPFCVGPHFVCGRGKFKSGKFHFGLVNFGKKPRLRARHGMNHGPPEGGGPRACALSPCQNHASVTRSSVTLVIWLSVMLSGAVAACLRSLPGVSSPVR